MLPASPAVSPLAGSNPACVKTVDATVSSYKFGNSRNYGTLLMNSVAGAVNTDPLAARESGSAGITVTHSRAQQSEQNFSLHGPRRWPWSRRKSAY